MAADFTLRDVIGVLRRDTAFLLFVLASLLCSIGYGQIDAGLIQYLQQQSVADLATLYALLIGINAGTIVIFQFPLLKLTARVSPFLRAMIGVALFAAGFFGFGLAPVEPAYGLMIAMFILSLGEAMVFPTMNIIIDRLAVPEMKGSYFGAFSISVVGFALAPVVGGALLYWLGGFALWMTMTVIALIVAALFLAANRFSERTA